MGESERVMAADGTLGELQLIELWEGLMPGAWVAPAVAAIAATQRNAGRAEELPIGRRDALLLRLRGRQLGDRLDLLAHCPACGIEAEVTLSCADLAAADTRHEATWSLETGEFRLRLRCVRSSDELLAAAQPDAEAARLVLLAGVVLEATRGGLVVPTSELPQAVVDVVGESILEHDPLAEIELTVACPACATEWREVIDPPQLVIEELAALGRDVLDDVDLLARRYGWTEDVILGLPPTRRATYVALAAA